MMWGVVSLLALAAGAAAGRYNYSAAWLRVPLDHFSYQRNDTFLMKYLVNDDHWDAANRGPIFFYTGNEGQIETFAENTGFMWEIAPEFKAKIVFAEHRYYGSSMPFGNKSLDNEHIGYLSAAQALADYVALIDHLQGGAIQPPYPVVAFGGSYGGMLAAYLRMKYPAAVCGALAASAPVHMFPGMLPCEVFHRIVTSSFGVASRPCVDNIRRSWATLRNFTDFKNESSAWLQRAWGLCEPPRDAAELQALVDYAKDMYVTLAMVNYPFASDFLLPLPAYPVRVACQFLAERLEGQKLLEGIGKVLKVYKNSDGTKGTCINYKVPAYTNLDAAGWDYQACTEMVMPMCTTGVADMFEPAAWNFSAYSQACRARYGAAPRADAARLQYGGARLRAASNIVFSNGLLDPWAGGGILSDVSESVRAVVVVDGAHHLDLMAASPADPPSVRRARDAHRRAIRSWLSDYAQNN